MRNRLALVGCLAALAFAGSPAVLPVRAADVQAQPKQPRFENEILAFEAADKASAPPVGAVLFTGSSSIRLWSTLARDFPELKVINRGFGGSQISDSVYYADRIVIPYKPKLIVFYAGNNDIAAGKTPAKVLADYQAFVEKVHAALPDTRIAYVSQNPSVLRWSQEGRLTELNRLIQEYVQKNDGKTAKLSFLESHSKLLSSEGKPRPEILRADGLHLNATGYELWTAILRPQILPLAAEKN